MHDSTGIEMAASRGPCASIPADRRGFVRQVLGRVGNKWSMLILAAVEGGPMRYRDLQRQIPGISSPGACSPTLFAGSRRTG